MSDQGLSLPTQKESEDVSLLSGVSADAMDPEIRPLHEQFLQAPLTKRHEVLRRNNLLTGGAFEAITADYRDNIRRRALQSIFGPRDVKIPPEFEAAARFYGDLTVYTMRICEIPLLEYDRPGVHFMAAAEKATGTHVREQDLAHRFFLLYTNRFALLFQKMEHVELINLDEGGLNLSAIKQVMVPLVRTFTIREMLAAALRFMGNSFFTYGPYNQNSNSFVTHVIKALAMEGIIYVDRKVRSIVGDFREPQVGTATEPPKRQQGMLIHGLGFSTRDVDNAQRYAATGEGLDHGGALVCRHIMTAQRPWTDAMKRQVSRLAAATTPEDIHHQLYMMDTEGIRGAAGDRYSVPEYLAGLVYDDHDGHGLPKHLDYKQVFPNAKGLMRGKDKSIEELTMEDRAKLTQRGHHLIAGSFWSAMV